MFKAFLPFLLLMVSFSLSGQQTVGNFLNLESSFNGYTLISPSANTQTYLIDNCGQIVNQWSSNYQPGASAYLLENGNLLRTARIQGSFSGGGIGGRVEMYSWDGVLLWSYNHATSEHHQHHDIEFLPNGNILILAWESRSTEEAIAQGRDPETIGSSGIWPEQIIEVKPIGSNEVEIVWEWHFWDHLIQDFDPTKPNYGVIKDHPELIDLNIVTGGGGGGGASTDWIHANSIDYNPELDQIMISSRTLNEIYIIDHSTTIEESAGHSGGIYGKGGDFLYRWGNPVMYERGLQSDQKLYGQHDAHWIPYDMPGGGDIMVFNNGSGRPNGQYSTVDVIKAPLDNDGSYIIEEDMPYGPEEAFWSYEAIPPNSFYASRISGAQRMPNGNTLICEGPNGNIFEIDENFNTVWSYISPVNQSGRVSQEADPGNNSVFRAYRYPPDYPAFEGIDLDPGDFLELNPIDYGCMIFSETSTAEEILPLMDVKLRTNPVEYLAVIENASSLSLSISVFDVNGKRLHSMSSSNHSIEIEVSQLKPGMYIFNIINQKTAERKSMKFVVI